jgi:hypothetical protein
VSPRFLQDLELVKPVRINQDFHQDWSSVVLIDFFQRERAESWGRASNRNGDYNPNDGFFELAAAKILRKKDLEATENECALRSDFDVIGIFF